MGNKNGFPSPHPIEVRGKGRRGTPTLRERMPLYGEIRS
jgi:hypothetical protein